MNDLDLTVWLALGAGFLSYISPCCLPLYPSYLSYITGISAKDIREGKGIFERRAFTHTLFFVMGFSIFFFAMGLSASWIGGLFVGANRDLIRQLGGIFVILMGLVLLGVFKPTLLMKEKRFQFNNKPVGYLGTFLIGITFSAGWMPCVGPILSSILALGVSDPNQAILYITAYTLGFALPFFIMAFFIGKLKWLLKYSNSMMKIGGGLMLITGVLLYFDQMTRITIWFIRLYGGFTGF